MSNTLRNFIPFSQGRASSGWVIVTLCVLLIAIIAIAHTTLGQKVRPQVRAQILQQMVNDGEIEASCAREGVANIISSVNTIDLNSDGKPEYFIWGKGCACFGASRCNVWIYRRIGSTYQKIFDGFPADDVLTMKNRTKSYTDLKVTFPSGDSFDSVIFKFDGRKHAER